MPDNVRVFLTICLLVALLQAAARGFRCFQLSAMKLQEDSQLGFFEDWSEVGQALDGGPGRCRQGRAWWVDVSVGGRLAARVWDFR